MAKRDPREEYRWLEEELLALEEEEEAVPEDEDLLEWWQEYEDDKTKGWNYGVYDDDPELDEDAAVLALTPKEKRQLEKQEKRQKKAEKAAKK